MDKKLKAKWVKALRSGKFKQGRNRLYDSDEGSYCCLGVLCKVAGATNKVLDDQMMPLHVDGFDDLIDADIADEIANMNDMRPSGSEQGDYGTDSPPPFELIAGFIDSNL